MRKQEGFTLIELTVVMVIMGFLMTMLIPIEGWPGFMKNSPKIGLLF